MDTEEAGDENRRLSAHLDHCLNFELHRRKLFFVDASLAWMLAQTNLDIEGRALRLPFPCFGQVYTDRATLETAEALLSAAGDALGGHRLKILTVYLKRLPAPEGRAGLSLSMVFDAQEGLWPTLLRSELSFEESDGLDDILSGRPAGAGAAAPRGIGRFPEGRRLIHLVLNAILYSTSADIAWPLSRAPAKQTKLKAEGAAKGRRARAEHRASELRRRYSDEDVYYLPGRIPISQLRALQAAEGSPGGSELFARFMVRGHWRRANPSWRDQRVRWIEPYWKGPELAAVIEKEYKLKI
jgi:hypothetical protein